MRFSGTRHGQNEMHLYRPRHGSAPTLVVIIRALNDAAERRMLIRVQLSQHAFVCMASGASMADSVAARAHAASCELLSTHPMLADTMRRIALAARSWGARLGGQSVQERVNPLLQSSDTGGTLPVAISDALLASGVRCSHALQLGLDLR